jgi:EmrB/QacA subfamily drug resistance transporter
LALALLALAQFVIILDASIVNVALPSIGVALDFSQDNLSWVVNAYTLTFGGFLLLGGRLADLMGRRRMFVSGLVLFTAASLLGGLAQSDVWLIAARAAQGLGAALVSPAALSLVTTIFREGAERNRAFGVWGAVAGSGGAAGVLLGGMLTEWAGWEWVLFVNVPIGLAAVALALRLLPESRDVGAARTFDAIGAVLVTGGLALLVYTLVDAESAGWTSAQTLGLGALSLVTLAAFVVWESRASDPLMPFSIFRLQTLRGANVVGLLLGMSLFSMFFFLSLYLQQVLGYSALETGFAFLPLAVMIIVCSTVASQLVTRTGARPTLVVGLLLITGALVWFSQVSAGGSYVGDVLFPFARCSRRPRLRLRPRDHRCGDGDAPRGGGAGVRPHQHEPADRRRAGFGDPGLGRHQPNCERRLGRRRRPGGSAERGFPDGVSRRLRVRAAGRDRGRPDDQLARLPQAAGGRRPGCPGALFRTAAGGARGRYDLKAWSATGSRGAAYLPR